MELGWGGGNWGVGGVESPNESGTLPIFSGTQRSFMRELSFKMKKKCVNKKKKLFLARVLHKAACAAVCFRNVQCLCAKPKTEETQWTKCWVSLSGNVKAVCVAEEIPVI